MSARRSALLFAALSVAPGCFNDGGHALTQTATSSPPDTSTTSATAIATSTSGPEPTSTSGPEPTSTSGPEPTSTMGASTTGAPMCGEPGQCEPGDVMNTGALCDPCGRTQVVCQMDCTWGPEICTQDMSSCAYWYFESNLETWHRVALPLPLPPHAPTQPIAAAFDLAEQQQIITLTQDTYHVYSRIDDGWIGSGPLDELLPGVATVLQAFAVYNMDPDIYDVVVITGETAALYTLAAGSYSAEYVQTDPCCASWNMDFSPPAIAAVRDIFTDLPNASGWGQGKFIAECFDNMEHALGLYAGWVTPTDVYLQDLGYCFELVGQTSYGSFPPFAAPGAPPGELVGGVALLDDRLYVFAGG